MNAIIERVGRAGIRLLFILLIVIIPTNGVGTIPTIGAGQTIDIDRISETLKSGPWAQVSGHLADVYEKPGKPAKWWLRDLAGGVKAMNRMVRVVDDLIVIDANSDDDPEAPLADLEALGLQNGAAVGAMVSSQRNIANEKADRMAAVVGAVRESNRKTLPYVRHLRAFRLGSLGRTSRWQMQ